MRTLSLMIVPTLLATIVFGGPIGCSYASHDKPVRWYPQEHDGQAVSRKVLRGGEHFVAVQQMDGRLRAWRDVTVLARRGDRLGFEQDDDGSLWATYPTTRQHLGTPPPEVRYVAWATRENRLGFADRPLRVAGEVVVTSVATVGGLALGTVAVVGLAILSRNGSRQTVRLSERRRQQRQDGASRRLLRAGRRRPPRPAAVRLEAIRRR